MYYEQADMAYAEYRVSHPDIMDGLTQVQREQFNKYMTNTAIVKLRKLSALQEGPYEFKGFKGNWGTGLHNAVVITGCGDVPYASLGTHFKSKAVYIQSVFNTAFKDLSYIAYLIREGLAEEWLEINMADRTKVFSSDYDSRDFEVCRQFYMLGMPIPQDLLIEYKTALRYVMEDARLDAFYSQIQLDYREFIGTHIALYDLVNKNVINGEVKTDDRGLVLLVDNFQSAVMKFQANGYKIEDLHTLPRGMVYRTAGANGTRLSTINEIKCMPKQVTCSEEVFMDLSSYQMLLAFCYYYTGDEKMLTLMNKFTSNTMTAIKADNTRKIIEVVLTYVYSAGMLEELRKAEIKKSSICYLDSAPDEIVDVSMEEKCAKLLGYHDDILKKAGKQKRSKEYDYNRFIVSLCTDWKRFGKLSHAQYQSLNKEYDKLRRAPTENFYNEDLKCKIEVCKKHMNYVSGRFPLNMMETVLRYKQASMKQAKVIEEDYILALEIMNNNFEDTKSLPETRKTPFAETSKASDSGGVQQDTNNATTPLLPTTPNFDSVSKGRGTTRSYDNYIWQDE